MSSVSLFKTGLRDLLRRPGQTGLMVLGVALGVAMVIAIDLANQSAERAFTLSTEAVVGRATHQVLGGPSGVPEGLYRQIRVDEGLRASAPVVTGSALAVDLGGEHVRILGVDPLAEAPFRDYLRAWIALPGFERFYTEPGEVVVGSPFADRHNLEPGDRVRLQVEDHFEVVRVLGVLKPSDDRTRLLVDDLLLMDLASAQELLGMVGWLSRIDLIAEEAVIGRLTEILPPGVYVTPSSQSAETAAQLTSAFRLNLTALSLLALVVGMFLIYNTVTFSVVQRRVVFGTLRSLGATWEQLFALVVLEAGLVSALGSTLGLGLGWFFGRGAVRLVSQTITDLYFFVSVNQVGLSAGSVVKGMALGILAGAFAAAPPAYEAASVPPVTSLRRSDLEGRVRDALPWMGRVGLALSGLGALTLLLIADSLTANFASVFAIIIGLALTVPTATIRLMRWVEPFLARVGGVIGRMAVRTVVNALSRTSIAIAALMVALSVTIGVGLMIASFRTTVGNWLDLTLRADIYVSTPLFEEGRPRASLSPEIVSRVEDLAGVQAVETLRSVVVDSEFGEVRLIAVDARRQRDAGVYRFASGKPDEVWEKVRGGAVIVSEPFAYRHGGNQLTLRTAHGLRAFPVVGVYYDYASDRGTVMMSKEVYQENWEDPAVSSFSVFVAEGYPLEDVLDGIRTALRGTGLQVQRNRAIRDQAMAIFDRTFAITAALRVLSIVVAFIGVLSALMALQIERTRELGTLQALGLTDRGLRGLGFLETGLMGFAAGLFSLPTGFLLALILIHVINLRSFGWTIRIELEPKLFAQAMSLGLLAAMAAAIYPVHRLTKIPVAEALRGE